MGGVDAGGQVDMLLGPGADLAAQVDGGARLEEPAEASVMMAMVSGLNGTPRLEKVGGVGQVAVAGGAELEARGPRRQVGGLGQFPVDDDALAGQVEGCTVFAPWCVLPFVGSGGAAALAGPCVDSPRRS